MNSSRITGRRAADAANLFDGRRLTLARHLAGWHKTDLAAAIGMSPTAVGAWESGAKRPTAATVAQLAMVLKVDPGFFVVRHDDLGAANANSHFRSLRSTTQIARDQADAYGRLAIDIAGNLERHVEFPQVDVPSFSVKSVDAQDNSPVEAARFVRRQWELGDGPLGNLVRLLENHGVMVVFSPQQTAAVDAYSFWTSLRPVVVLNPGKRDYYRQRFDVAHELGHLVMHRDTEPGGRLVEEQAHRFAAELLTPENGILDLLPTTMGGHVWVNLAKLKEQWGVSIQALLFRARRLGRLSDISYRNAMATVSARGWRRQEPGLMTRIETPSLMPKAIEILTKEGIDENVLIDQCRAPVDLFRVVTARHPEINITAGSDEEGKMSSSSHTVSLLHSL